MARIATKPYLVKSEMPLALSFDDVLLVPRRSNVESRADVNLATKLATDLALKFPVLSINMDTVTGVEMAVAIGKYGGMGYLPRFDAPEVQASKVAQVKKKGVLVGAAVGCREGFMQRAEALVKAGVDMLTLDVAHGHMTRAIAATKLLKQAFPKVALSAGVIGTYEGAYDLFKAGADAVRVGVGPGTICTTRQITGCGVPQITAVLEAARASKRFKNKYVISDGGTKNSGDIVKALAAGAHAVFVGSQLAGTREAPGKVIKKRGKLYKRYDASTSETQKGNHVKKNGEKRPQHYLWHIEGVESLVPYKGLVKDVLRKLEAGIRSGFSYCGAHNLQELHKNARFIRITPAGMRESGAHDVIPI